MHENIDPTNKLSLTSALVLNCVNLLCPIFFLLALQRPMLSPCFFDFKCHFKSVMHLQNNDRSHALHSMFDLELPSIMDNEWSGFVVIHLSSLDLTYL